MRIKSGVGIYDTGVVQNWSGSGHLVVLCWSFGVNGKISLVVVVACCSGNVDVRLRTG